MTFIELNAHWIFCSSSCKAEVGRVMLFCKRYQENAEYFMYACLQKGNRNVHRTLGGLLFWQKWNNIQFVTSASFLLTVYSDYLTAARKNLQCSGGTVQPSELLSFSQSQVCIQVLLEHHASKSQGLPISNGLLVSFGFPFLVKHSYFGPCGLGFSSQFC